MKDFFNKETLDKIKQFCMINKKYVGVAGVLLGLIIILIVVVAGGDNGKKDNSETETQVQISVEDFEFEKDYTDDSKDEISKLLTDYYNAYVSDDLDTLGKLAYPMTDNEKSYIGVVSQYYEAISDVTPYTKSGLEKGSYFVSVQNNIKFYGVNTVAPTLDFFYIETDKDGNLYINNVYSNFNRTYEEEPLEDDVLELIGKYTASSEFAELQESVQQSYEDAVGKDADLKAMLETTLSGAIKQWYTTARVEIPKEDATESETQTEDTQTPDTQQEQPADQTQDQAQADQNAQQPAADENQAAEQPAQEQPAAPAEYQVVTKDVVKVRDGASTDANELGLLKEGVTLTAYGTEGEWTIVSYSAVSNGRAYIKTDNLQTAGQ